MFDVFSNRSPRYSQNQERFAKGDASPCVLCGKAVEKPRYEVHLHQGGSHVVTEKEARCLDPGGDMGMYPLGAECYKRCPGIRPYVHDSQKEQWIIFAEEAVRRYYYPPVKTRLVLMIAIERHGITIPVGTEGTVVDVDKGNAIIVEPDTFFEALVNNRLVWHAAHLKDPLRSFYEECDGFAQTPVAEYWRSSGLVVKR